MHQERSRRHDLAGLAIAALDHFHVEPGLLHPGAVGRFADGLDRGDCPLADRADRQEAGTHRLALEMDRAGAALGDAAAELGAGQAQDIAQDPQERHVRGYVDLSPSALIVRGIMSVPGRSGGGIVPSM